MFLCPLLGCALPGLIGLLLPSGLCVSRVSFNLWNSGVAAVLFGLLHRGIVNVSGRVTWDDRIFYVLGEIFLVAAVCTELIITVHRRSTTAQAQMKENGNHD